MTAPLATTTEAQTSGVVVLLVGAVGGGAADDTSGAMRARALLVNETSLVEVNLFQVPVANQRNDVLLCEIT